MRHALIVVALLAGCSNSDYVVVSVHGLPADTSYLNVRSALDEQPPRAIEEFDRPSSGFGTDTSFALALPPTTTGRLSVSVEAWVNQCAAASRSGDVVLGAAEVLLDLSLDAIAPQDCSGAYEHLPDMVRVPGARFEMGCDGTVDPSCEMDELPVHAVTVSSFFIDRTEVSTAAYGACQAHGGCGPALLDQAKSSTAESFITWDAAQAFCTAHGKRLPTEAEWELAARGTDGRIYPWGNAAPTCAQANFLTCYDVGGNVVGPIDQFSGVSPYGALGMAGNVEEWVADWYNSVYPSTPVTDPTGPATGIQRVLRGGSWLSSAEEVRASRRNANAPDASSSSESAQANSTTFGIRCARSQ